MCKGSVYRDEGACPVQTPLANLKLILNQLGEMGCPLHTQLAAAIDEVERACQAVKGIYRGPSRVGWGVDETKKNLAIENAISILKEIKKVKGW